MTFDKKKVLVTGGTGSVGSAFVAHLLQVSPQIGEIIVFSNSEQEQYEMASWCPPGKFPVRYVIGDVRDRERVMSACRGVDVIVHAAAMKHVPIAEANAVECTKTNVLGSQNVIESAVAQGVGTVVAVSTDKAVAPINVYGASKLLLERLFLNASGHRETKFSVVRYANVFGSKGSVVPLFLKQRDNGSIPITDPAMTRFSITMQDGLDLIVFAVAHGWGGDVILPVSPSYRILDVAEALAPGVPTRIVGIRPGEKIHEVMFGASESPRAVRRGNRYVICPEGGKWNASDYCRETGAEKVADGFEYESGTNSEWLSVEMIRQLVPESSR